MKINDDFIKNPIDFTILTNNVDSIGEYLNTSYYPSKSVSFEQGFEVQTNLYSLKNVDIRKTENLGIPDFIK
jgi:hypothetical protein